MECKPCIQIKVCSFKLEQELLRSRKLKKDRYNDQTKGTSRQAMTYKAPHRKLRIVQHEPHLLARSQLMCSGRVGSSCSISDTRRVTVKRQEHYLTKQNKLKYLGCTICDCMLLSNIPHHTRNVYYWALYFT